MKKYKEIKRRKRICYKAMKVIAEDEQTYSCIALLFSGKRDITNYTGRYAYFYGKHVGKVWVMPSSDAKNHRLMLLALFAEVGVEGMNEKTR